MYYWHYKIQTIENSCILRLDNLNLFRIGDYEKKSYEVLGIDNQSNVSDENSAL